MMGNLTKAWNLNILILLYSFVSNCPHNYLETRWLVIAIVISFTIALIIHGHQTEATYRLDFLWKLQATGFYNFPLNFSRQFNKTLHFPLRRGERRDGASASLQQETSLQHSSSPCGRLLYVWR